MIIKKEDFMKIVLLEGLGVSDNIISEHQAKLEKMGHTFVAYPKDVDANVQSERIKDADVVMLANMPLDKKAVEGAENLKFIDVAFTGVDHIPMDVAKTKNITVSNASGYATCAVAELCIATIIVSLRNVKKVQDRCREGKTKDGLVGTLLNGKTIGIVGAGAIGKKVASLAKAFGCHVIAYSRSTINDQNIDEQVSLDEVMQRSDIVSLHCPLTDATRGMIDASKIALMKKSAILVNTARGAVVDSNALADALNEERIAGAVIDVFEKEPPLDTNHPLLHSKNTIVTPHIAFASKESMELRAEIVFNNLYSWLEGNPVNVVK